MANPGRGEADYYEGGSWNAVCYQCGRKRKAGMLMRHWEGYYVCPEHWEERQPQDFVRGVQDVQTPPWTQPDSDAFIPVCSEMGSSAMPGASIPGCMIPNRPLYYITPLTVPGYNPTFD